MSKAPPGLHEHDVTLSLCKSEGSVQEGQKKDLKVKAVTGLKVSRSQGYVMLQFCTFHQKTPNQLTSFPRAKNQILCFPSHAELQSCEGDKAG